MSDPVRPAVVINTNYGAISVSLRPDVAPVTVANFLQYVDTGFYPGTIFHRVIEGFMIQGGGFTSDLALKTPQAPIVLESNNGLSNLRGTIAMARTNVADSATSQFYINTVDNLSLDYRSATSPGYAVFGNVTAGMSVVDAIEDAHTFKVRTASTLLENLPFPFRVEILDVKRYSESEGGLATTHASGQTTEGVSVARYAGSRADYDVQRLTNGSLSVKLLDGQHQPETLSGISRLMFDDTNLAYDVAGDGAAGLSARLINAAFGYTALTPELSGIALSLFDQGHSLQEIAGLALSTELWRNTAGGTDHASFVRTVYRNVVGSSPDAATQAQFQGLLDRGEMTQAALLALAAESDANANFIDLIGLARIGLEY